jgi:hypothetical protein
LETPHLISYLGGRKTECFFLKFGNMAMIFTHDLFNIAPEVLATAVRKEKEIKGI